MAEISDFDPTDDNNVARWPENMLGSGINNAGRADEGILARWFRDTNGSITASGSSNAFAITSTRTISALADNLVMAFTANHTIAGAATLDLNGLGAKGIKRFNGLDLAAGDIVSGQPLIVIYKTAADVWFMMTAPAAITGNMFEDFAASTAPANPAADVARLYGLAFGGESVLAYRRSDGSQILLWPATQANMVTGTDVDRFVTPGRQRFHPLHPKASGYVLANGTVQHSINITSVIRISDGRYNINLPFSLTNIRVQVTCDATGDSGGRIGNAEALAANQIRIVTARPGAGGGTAVVDFGFFFDIYGNVI